MKNILLAGRDHEEKLIIENISSAHKAATIKLLHEYILPGGISLLKNFLQKILPEENIINLEISNDKFIQIISEAKNTLLSNPDSVHINRTIGHLVLSDKLSLNEEKITIKPNKADLLLIKGLADPTKITDQWIDKDKSIIIVTANESLIKNPLLDKLSDTNSKQLIIIVDADDLRDMGMNISSKLSWDKTLQEFRKEYYANPIFKYLNKCAALLIRFGQEASLLIFNTYSESPGGQKSNKQFLFYYIPSMYEGQLMDETEGSVSGLMEVFEAAFIKTLLYPTESTLEMKEKISVSLVAAMKSSIQCQKSGYIKEEKKDTINYPVSEIFSESFIAIKVAELTEIMNSEEQLSLLDQNTFNSKDLLHYLAILFAKEGKSNSFDVFPYAEFNKLKSYDREEIEDLRGLKVQISNYLTRNDNKPLSVGVFGPPGSGKSFGVKQIAEYFKKRISVCEYNLSQFSTYDDVINAFREVSDITLQGKIPLVFFDEFDCDCNGKPLGWLVNFLSPMQDGVYKAGEKIHPLGRGIFVFAGGNFSTYEQFNALVSDDDYKNQYGDNNPYIKSLSIQQIKSAKVEDFISRLKWHLNIKGINKKNEQDRLYTLRRAMVLRNLLSNYPSILDSKKRINIDNDLLFALMEIDKFKFGARSLETIIKSCGLENKNGFHKASLPTRDQLKRDVDTEQFEKLLKEQYILPSELIEPVAQEIHEKWLVNEEAKSSVKVTMKPWNELNEDMKDSNRQQAIDMIRKMQAYGYSVIPSEKITSETDHFSFEEIEQMAKMEHDRWMNEKIAKGWIYGKKRNDELKIHDCLQNWNELDEKTKELDRNAVRIIPELLKSVGFHVVKEN